MKIIVYQSNEHSAIVQSWLDTEASQNTGIENWDEDVCYWQKETPETFRCLVFGFLEPSAAAYFFVQDENMHVGELIVVPNLRGRGVGPVVLKYLTDEYSICNKATAVVYPHNIPSPKAFVKAGFQKTSSPPDGDADYYIFCRQIITTGDVG